MKRHLKLILVPLCGMLLALGAGCGRRGQEDAKTPAGPAAPAGPPAGEVFRDEVNRLFFEGRTNEVLVVLEEGLQNPALSDSYAPILREILSLRLRMGDVDDARQRYLEALERHPEVAASAFGVIASFYRATDQQNEIAPWCETLLDRELPQNLRSAVYRELAALHRSAGDMEALNALLARIAEDTPEQLAPVTGATLRDLRRERQWDRLETVLAFLEQNMAEQPEVKVLVPLNRAWAAVLQQEVEQAAALLRQHMEEFADAEAASILQAFLRAAEKENRPELAEQLSKEALDRAQPGSRLFAVAAHRWLTGAREGGNAAELMDRIDFLMERSGGDPSLIRLVSEVFYFMMEHGDMPVRRRLMAVCETLQNKARSEAEQSHVATLLLDGSFMVEDYDRAIRILESGAPIGDEAWRATLIPKVKAHRALAQGETREAIGFFREFMQHVADSEEDITDPVSGSQVPRESVLGLNAARIGDLWKSIGEEAEAASAYTEARAFYEKALELMDPDTPQYKDVQASLDRLPSSG